MTTAVKHFWKTSVYYLVLAVFGVLTPVLLSPLSSSFLSLDSSIFWWYGMSNWWAKHLLSKVACFALPEILRIISDTIQGIHYFVSEPFKNWCDDSFCVMRFQNFSLHITDWNLRSFTSNVHRLTGLISPRTMLAFG